MSSKIFERVKSLDLYLLLEVDQDAEEKGIKKAYRRKALSCHPDKNPGDKNAVALFHQLSDALEVLTDVETRKAYDNLLKARKAAELRTRQLDSKRRKFKDDLDAKEKESYEEVFSKEQGEAKLAREIDRLRKEGSRQLAEEQEALKRQLAEERLGQRKEQEDSVGGRLKVKWDRKGSMVYTEESLHRIFTKYGEVAGIVVSSKKGGSAIVELATRSSAVMASNIETGMLENPIKVKPLWEEVEPGSNGHFSASNQATGAGSALSTNNTDFESLVMRKLRQEEERKRLIQQMLLEDS